MKKKYITAAEFDAKFDAGKDITVLTFAQASKVLFDDAKKAAIGVRVERFGQEFDYFVGKEVILSAGAIGSPQILMLSGVGPKSELKEHGISVLHELPVGRNLQDHCLAFTQSRIGKPDGQMALDVLNVLSPSNFIEYIANGTGPVANTNVGVEGVIKTPSFKKEKRPSKD